MQKLFIISYDRFYNSDDVIDLTNVDNLAKFIEEQKDIHDNDGFGYKRTIFNCYGTEEYTGYVLEENKFGYTVTLNFVDDEHKFDLVRVNLF